MDKIIKIAGLSGSLRKDSYNTRILHLAEKLLPEGTTLQISDFRDLPLYDADLDLPEASERPEAVSRFRRELAGADGILIVSPEYNYSIPGGLKNAIDWASRGTDSPLMHKPVALVGASPGLFGTVRMQLAFLPVFQFLNMKPVYKPEVLISQVNQKFNADGEFTDKAAEGFIRQKLQGLKDLILQQSNSAA